MTKYTKATVAQICTYIMEGDSQKVAAQKAGVSKSQFHEWKKSKPEFADALKIAKDEFLSGIVNKLETSLWKRATGYEVTETDTEYVSDEDGAPKVKSQRKKTKHIAPDTGALVFALTNLCPERWVNKQRTEVQESERADTEAARYSFEDLPDELLYQMADKMQEAEFKKLKEEKNGKKE